jgi:hypothetical protein
MGPRRAGARRNYKALIWVRNDYWHRQLKNFSVLRLKSVYQSVHLYAFPVPIMLDYPFH